MNYNIQQMEDSTVHTYETAPYGDARREVEKAAQRAFHNDTSDVRAALVAADMVEVNENHPHATSYVERAAEMDVTRETFERGDHEYVRITIEVDE